MTAINYSKYKQNYMKGIYHLKTHWKDVLRIFYLWINNTVSDNK